MVNYVLKSIIRATEPDGKEETFRYHSQERNEKEKVLACFQDCRDNYDNFDIKISTMSGSNCVPLFFTISLIASSFERAFL